MALAAILLFSVNFYYQCLCLKHYGEIKQYGGYAYHKVADIPIFFITIDGLRVFTPWQITEYINTHLPIIFLPVFRY